MSGGSSAGGMSGGSSAAGGSSGGGFSGGGTSGGSSGGAAAIDHNAVGAIVVLGSSTAAGTGPTDPKNAWVERYRAYLKTEFPMFVLTNLAVGGYATADIQPSDYQNPGKAGHNITAALNLAPNAIIINMPTNDTEYGVSANAQMVNFARVTDLATKSGVPCWVTTSQPRDFKGESAQDVNHEASNVDGRARRHHGQIHGSQLGFLDAVCQRRWLHQDRVRENGFSPTRRHSHERRSSRHHGDDRDCRKDPGSDHHQALTINEQPKSATARAAGRSR